MEASVILTRYTPRGVDYALLVDLSDLPEIGEQLEAERRWLNAAD